MTPEAAFAGALAAAGPVSHLGLAVSGGGDSMAMLHLAHDWAETRHMRLSVASVDHRLRAEAADEAALVGQVARGLGLRHDILTWDEAPGQGNLQDAARRARLRLLGDWARARGCDAVALGHTRDDQAETFLMRLARGSGVDGLAPMRRDWHEAGMRWLRPLLEVPRRDLRRWLAARALVWVEDSSNEDRRFARVRARDALAALAPLGLDAEALVATAARMGRARAALEHAALQAARRVCTVQSGDVVFAPHARDLPEETFTRLVAHALGWVASSRYRPRYRALTEALAQLHRGTARSLHGCLLMPEAGGFRITREYQALGRETCAPGALWDQRWRLSGPASAAGAGAVVRALGPAIAECPDWRATGRPRAALMADPAVFSGADLIAAPLAGRAAGWQAKLTPACGDFFHTLLSH